MKINKVNVLNESVNDDVYVDIAEVPLDETVEETAETEKKEPEQLEEKVDLTGKDLDSMSKEDLIQMLKDAAEEDNAVPAETDEAEDAVDDFADDVFKAADLIKDPYGALNISGIDEALQVALNAALRARKAGYDADYPNVLLSGLAGFGKTAAVKQFCKDHKLNLFECDAKSLDVATVGGIPYPVKDKNGTWKQHPVASNYWDKLSAPNTVLFLDEFNRAAPNVAGTLLGLINNHDLPMTTTTNGKTRNVKHFDNILFTVVALNPASDVFADVNEFTPEKVSRNAIIYDIEPDPKELWRHLQKIYDVILQDPLLDDEVLRAYEGQKNIAEKLLNDSRFTFDNADDVRRIHRANNESGKMTNFLNYRTFVGVLMLCDGTALNYKANLKFAKFAEDKQTMITNILTDYKDKPLKGNTVFTKAQQQATALADANKKAAAASGIKTKLKGFGDALKSKMV